MVNPVHAQQKKGTTLSDALRIGVSTNPQYGAAMADRKASAESLKQGEAGFLPSIDMSADAGAEYTDDQGTRIRESDGTAELFRKQVGVSLTQMLFDGWATAYDVQGREARVKASDFNVHETAELVGLSIVEAYLDVLRQRQILMTARQNIQEHLDILSLIEAGVQSGRQTPADAAQVKARLAAARANEANTLQSLRNAEAEYKRAVGTNPDELEMPKLPAEQIAKDVELEVVNSLNGNPSIRASESEIDFAKAQKEGVKSNFYPEVGVKLNTSASHDLGGLEGTDKNASALLSMNWNLYRGGADTARAREYAFRHEKSKFTRDDVLRKTENDVRQTWASMEAARVRAKEFLAMAQANEEVVRAYKDQFTLDRRSLLDVLDSQNELFSARTSVINTEFLELFAIYRLMALKGTLLPALGVPYNAVQAQNSTPAREKGFVKKVLEDLSGK